MAARRHSKLLSFLSSQYPDFDLEHPTERLCSLYSDFTKIAPVNKYGYHANIRYWRTVILESSAHGVLGSPDYTLAFDPNTVSEQFVRPFLGKPYALECVFTSMMESGELMALQTFERTFQPRATWMSWMMRSMASVPWQWRSGSSSDLLIVLPTVKQLAKRIQKDHYRRTMNCISDHLLTLDDFRERYGKQGDTELTDDDLALLLRYLSSQMGVSIEDNVKGYATTYMIIKFPEKREASEGAATITDHDKAIVSIKTTCRALKLQVDELQQKSDEFLKISKTHCKHHRRPQALYALRRKKHLQEILVRRLQSLETMETMLMKIETSKDDHQVVQAFSIGADALRNTLRHDDLTLASVDEVMAKLQDTLEDQKEVEDAISLGMEGATPTDGDEELEHELAELEAQALQLSVRTPPTTHTQPEPSLNVAHPSSSTALKDSTLSTSQAELQFPDPPTRPPQPTKSSTPSKSNTLKQADSELARLNQVLSTRRKASEDDLNASRKKRKKRRTEAMALAQ